MYDYDIGIIGGGPAGLTTALYTTRLGHSTIVYDRGGGRCAMMGETHNVIGTTEETSGIEFLQTSIEQIQEYGANYEQESVKEVESIDNGFMLKTSDDKVKVRRVVIATGFSDKHPPSPSPRTSRGLHYCLHCDAYMFIDESVYVMGHNESAAKVAMIMLNFTDDVDILLRGEDPEWSKETKEQLEEHPINIVKEEVTGIENEDGWLKGIEFKNGTFREYKGGFAMYGSEYNNQIPRDLGCDINEDGSVIVDDHGNTTIDGVYAVGDLTEGHNQIPVRMGQGAKAGIDIHYDLREYPKQIGDLDDIDDKNIPPISDKLRKKAEEHNN